MVTIVTVLPRSHGRTQTSPQARRTPSLRRTLCPYLTRSTPPVHSTKYPVTSSKYTGSRSRREGDSRHPSGCYLGTYQKKPNPTTTNSPFGPTPRTTGGGVGSGVSTSRTKTGPFLPPPETSSYRGCTTARPTGFSPGSVVEVRDGSHYTSRKPTPRRPLLPELHYPTL